MTGSFFKILPTRYKKVIIVCLHINVTVTWGFWRNLSYVVPGSYTRKDSNAYAHKLMLMLPGCHLVNQGTRNGNENEE